ncbi:MAG: phosphotransferase family protein [Deltaproteobacteria bacterium]|nr:phosphotransferase family protein [Deltaproteobacteria bacterium]
MDELDKLLQVYLRNRCPEEQRSVVIDLERIHGGASRATYRFGLKGSDPEKQTPKRFILRLDQEASLIDTDHGNEFYAYRAFQSTDVPVPRTYWFEEDPRWLGGAFFLMEEIVGCDSSPRKIVTPPYDAVREKIGEAYCHILGAIARADPAALGFTQRLETPIPDTCWRRELDYWEAKILSSELEPQPVARAAVRWLRRHPPPPAQKVCVVHGDYRLGNLLYDAQGKIRAVLDWEMCHLGDPLEDLAYGFNILWTMEEPEKVGRMISRERAVALWEESSGFRAVPEALYWWEVFTSVKALGIWLDAGRKFTEGSNFDPILAHTGYIATDLQNMILLNLLGKLA